MTARTGSPMPPPPDAGNRRDDDRRHVFGPRPVGALLAPVTRPAFKRRSPAAAQVMADWAAIMGPALSVVTAPRSLHGGSLSIACSGPIALELQHLSAQLVGRINAALGQAAVQRLRFVQTGAPAAAAAPARAPVPPGVAREAEARVAGLPEGELRDALSALGRAVLARQHARKSQ